MLDTDIRYDGTQAVDTARIRELLSQPVHEGITPDAAVELAGLVRHLLARPIPNVTRNGGKIVRAVIDGKPREPGAYKTWWVACEDDEEWVTWECYVMDDGDNPGHLAYNGGDYFFGPDQKRNKRRALRSLASRAGVPVATLRMDTDDAYAALCDKYGLYRLDAKTADRLITRALAAPGTEVKSKGAALTATLPRVGEYYRFDLRDLTKHDAQV